MNRCEVCQIEFEGRKDAKYCSSACRKKASRLAGVTDNVTLSEPDVTLNFRFTIAQHPGSKPGDKDWNEKKARIREEKYWYDIPLAAVPVREKGWPEVPMFETKDGREPMNGRQYFLWMKNDFEVAEDGTPIIHNPFPPLEGVRYEMGGEGARRWGA